MVLEVTRGGRWRSRAGAAARDEGCRL